MSKFLVKTAALAFICCNASLLFSATNDTENATQGMKEIHLHVPSAALPFQACVLDFSARDVAAVSASKLTTLFLENEEKLTPLFVTYLIFEALAAETRALPDSLGVVSQALNTHTSSSTNAVYEAFQKIQGTINTTKDLNAILFDQQACTAFVTTEFTQDLPKLLAGMQITGIDNSAITIAVTSFIPTISGGLFKAYSAMHVLAGKAIARFQTEAEHDAGCCLSWFCLPWCITARTAVSTIEK